MKSSGEVTFSPSSVHEHLAEGVFRVKRNPDASDKTRAEALQFARIVANALVNCGMRHEWQLKSQCPQKVIDLQKAVQLWMIEDGIVKRMFNDILDSVEVVKVMDS